MLLQPRTPPSARGAALRVPLPVAIVAGSLLLGALSLLAPSAPTYDPFAWIIWGREILHLDLDTVDGPSWKPLPVIVTTLSAPFGEASPYVWVAVGRAGAIAGLVVAFLLARRLAGVAAGLGAAIGIGLMPWWIRNGAMANSEGLMVALVFGAVLVHLHGRRGWALALAIGAGLLRPEAWPFLGLYALWLLLEDRSRLTWVAASLASLPVLWLGPELWGSGNAFRASDRAQLPLPESPAFADDPALELLHDADEIAPTLGVAGAAVAVVLALVLRGSRSRHDRRTVLVLAALAVAWILLVALMTVRGFSGNTRYLITPVSMLVVLGAVGVAWAVRAAVPAVARLPALAAIPAAAVLGAGFAAPVADQLGFTLRNIEYQAQLYDDLKVLVDREGGRELARCGQVYTGDFLVPAVAWQLGLHIAQVKIREDFDPARRATIFHVRTEPTYGLDPAVRIARPHELGRRGQWLLTSDCPGGRP